MMPDWADTSVRALRSLLAGLARGRFAGYRLGAGALAAANLIDLFDVFEITGQPAVLFDKQIAHAANFVKDRVVHDRFFRQMVWP